MSERAARAAEHAARHAYGRLLALLAARTRDLAGAEDALAGAFQQALQRWPEDGVPRNPDAWLLTVARRMLGHAARHARVRDRAAEALRLLEEERGEAGEVADERLKLMFVCAHPAIDASVHTALMLQTVLGLEAGRIAAAFGVGTAAMAQRLVRAKAKIRVAGIAFAVPEAEELAGRVEPVLEAIYAAYGAGWDGEAPLAEEAVWLARLTAELLPEEAEVLGLLALLLHCQARQGARRDAAGRFVPLEAQDRGRWDRGMQGAAETVLRRAQGLGRIGHFQLEAAIQSAHAAEVVDRQAVVMLYEGLVRLAPGLGALVGRAAAIGEAYGAAAGLAALEAVEGAGYQPWWAVRGHLLGRIGDARAGEAYRRAAEMTGDPAVRAYLLAQGGIG